MPESTVEADNEDLMQTETDDSAEKESPDRDWQAEYLREAAQSRRYRQRAQRAETEIDQLRRHAPSEQQAAELARLRERAGELTEKDKRVGVLEDMLRDTAGMNELAKSLAACGVGSGCPHGRKMLDQATSLLAGRIDVDVSGQVPAARVLDPSGNVLCDDGGQPVSVQQFVSHWLAEEGSHFLPASGDTGSGAHRGPSAPPGTSLEQLDRDPKAKAEFIAKYGPQAYVQLARKQR